MNLARRLPEVLVPALLVLATALLGLAVSSYLQVYFLDTLILVAIVVGLYVFIGNSGVLSFGQISFVSVGAWTAGVLTVPRAEKPIAMPGLAHFLVTTNVGNITSLALAAAIGGAFAFAVGLPLMRLSGLAAGIATFAVLEITNNVLNYEPLVGPALNNFSSVPQTTGIWQAAIGVLICIAVAYGYQRTRFGRMLRATREDPAAASRSSTATCSPGPSARSCTTSRSATTRCSSRGSRTATSSPNSRRRSCTTAAPGESGRRHTTPANPGPSASRPRSRSAHATCAGRGPSSDAVVPDRQGRPAPTVVRD